MKYKIYMKAIQDLPEGFCCGHSKRIHPCYYRTTDESEADSYDDVNAVLISKRYRKLGYPCAVFPKITERRMLEILY